MAIKATVLQSSLEELVFPIDWEKSMLPGVTVSDITITYIGPETGAPTFGKEVVSDYITYVNSPSGLSVATHYVSVVATTTDADLSPEVYLIIVVDR